MNALDLVCQHFRSARDAGGACYVFHFPRQSRAYIGLGVHQTVSYKPDGFLIQTSDRQKRAPPVEKPFSQMRSILDDAYPSVWMASPDLYRSAQDPDLPLLYCVQPKFEIELRGYAADRRTTQNAYEVTVSGWETEADEKFVDRLSQAIQTLQSYPEGKMIITRPYAKTISSKRDPFGLFERFASMEPSAACSHYLEVGPDVHSIGCSPENVFEIDHGRLIFDVVAATRGISADPEIDKKRLHSLLNSPKERREHLMAFNRYCARIKTMIEPESFSIDRHMDVLELGSVRHLYSRLSGRLQPGWDWLSMLENSFPALTSYPDELRGLSDLPSEPSRFYGGVLGRVGAGGAQAAFFLNLRAALVKGSKIYTQGGVGVVMESEAHKELREVNNKLKNVMRAISEWDSDQQYEARS
jgi:anthranilate/para-aminobenzoate synthase component I